MRTLVIIFLYVSCLAGLLAQTKRLNLGGGLAWQGSWGMDLELSHISFKSPPFKPSNDWIRIDFPESATAWTLALRPSYVFERETWLGALEGGWLYQNFKTAIGWSGGLRMGGVLDFTRDLGQIYLKPILGINLIWTFYLEYGYALALSNRNRDLFWSPHQIQLGLRWPIHQFYSGF